MPLQTSIIDVKSTSVKKSGFTLIELLIAIAILGIISSVVTFGLTGHQKKARDAQRKSNLQELKKAMQSAKNDCRSAAYFSVGSIGASDEKNYYGVVSNFVLSPGKYISATINDPKYIASDPETSYRFTSTATVGSVCPNPTTGAPNAYNGAQNYVIRARLELGANDPDSNRSRTNCSSVISAIIADGMGSYFDVGGVNTPPAANDGFFYVCGN